MAADNPHPASTTGWFAPRRAFVWLALAFGIPLALITAPFQAPDEPQHLLRAYQISEGNFRPRRMDNHGGGWLPVSLVEAPRPFADIRFYPKRKTSWPQIRSAMRVPLDPDRRDFIPFVTAIYSPVAYLPQAGAMAIGRRLSLPPLAMMYLARLFNLIAWIGLGYLALRITPVCARPLLLLLMMPMSLFLAASMSPDATTNGLAVLFTAMVLRFALLPSDRKIAWVQWSGLTLLSAALAVTKFAYVPLSMLVLLIPSDQFGSPRRWKMALTALFAANLLAIAMWEPETRGLQAIVRDRTDVSPVGQLYYLRDHPSALVLVPCRTLMIDGWGIVRSFVGWLGSMDTRMSALFVIAYLCVLFLACWAEKSPGVSLPLARWMRITLLPVALSVAAIGLLNYMYWTPVGENHVEGLQGRYLLPLAPGIIYLVWALSRKLPPFPWNGLSQRTLDRIACGVSIFSSTYAIILVFFRYYVH